MRTRPRGVTRRRRQGGIAVSMLDEAQAGGAPLPPNPAAAAAAAAATARDRQVEVRPKPRGSARGAGR
jgi:hypothetical protein